MKLPLTTPLAPLHSAGWWAWLALLVLFAPAGCKPREVVCESRAFFRLLEPGRGAGAAPFSIQRPGSEVRGADLEAQPTFMTFADNGRARIEWMMGGHMMGLTEVIYSTAEELARDVSEPGRTFPMKRWTETSGEGARLGFRSAICRDDAGHTGNLPCRQYGKEELFLVADMSCVRR